MTRSRSPRRSTRWRTLKPAFVKDGGTVTAAKSSKINDGAAALIVTSPITRSRTV
jgi:acetyl-CoA C-acetyltransferase